MRERYCPTSNKLKYFLVNLKCQLVRISPPSNVNLILLDVPSKPYFIKTPIYTSYTYCSNELFFISINENLTQTTTPNTLDTIFNVSPLQFGPGYTYFSVNQNLSPMDFKINSSRVFNIYLNISNEISTIYQLNLTCLKPDYSNAKIKIIKQPQQTEILGIMYATIKIEDTTDLNDVLLSTLEFGQLQNSGDGNYLIGFSNDYIEKYIFDFYWNVTVEFTVKKLNVSFENPYYDLQFGLSNENFEHFQTYLNEVSNENVNEFGLGLPPIFTFKRSSSSLSPFQYMRLPYTTYIKKILHGSIGNVTYIDIFTNSYGTEPINNTIAFFNGSSVETKIVPIIYKILSTPNNPSFGIFNNVSPNNIFMFKHSFVVQPNYFNTYNIYYKTNSINTYWPFGFISGNRNVNFTHEIAIPYDEGSINGITYYYITSLPTNVYSNIGPTNISPVYNKKCINSLQPKLNSYEFIKLYGSNYLLKMDISSSNGLYKISGDSLQNKTFSIGESLTTGDIYNGVFEILIDVCKYNLISIIDQCYEQISYKMDSIVSYNPLLYFKSPNDILNGEVLKTKLIDNISFLYNNLNLNDEPSYNSIFVKLKDGNGSTNQSILFLIYDPFNIDTVLSTWDLEWNGTQYIGNFILPRGYKFGVVEYTLKVSSSSYIWSVLFPESHQLIVNETYIYNSGPIFSNIQKINDNQIINGIGMSIGWRFTITDDYNGFEKGYIKVMGSIDNSVYNYYFNYSNSVLKKETSIYKSDYQILINMSSIPKFIQDYVITSVILTSTNGQESIYNIYQDTEPNPQYSIINPFRLFLNDSNILKVSYDLSSIQMFDNVPPSLLNFKTSLNTPLIDVGLINRSITFDFEAVDDKGLKNDQYPIVYLVGKRLEVVQCISSIVIYNETFTKYTCTLNLPYGFGYPGPVLISVYGFINTFGVFRGFSSFDLNDSGFSYYINTTLSLNSNQPYILSSNKFFSIGGKLVLTGKLFENVQQILIKYYDPLNENSTILIDEIYSPSKIYSTAIIIENVRPITKPFIVIAKTLNSQSNSFTIYPIYYKLKSIEPPEVLPTNSPQQCQGIPQTCGGSKRGYCTDNGCLCYPPYVGTTCSSEIIIVPTPTINTTSPSTEIPFTNNDNGIFFKSLISIIGLRELDFEGNQIELFLFDKWIFTEINKTSSLYFTNITKNSSSSSSSSSTTNITVSLDWFENETTINFANQNLVMMSSSMKYTINISKYSFSNQLNQLELIMSASLESSKSNDICSNEEFGETSSGDNSNFIKIQIENRSLYGRFIRRAIIDNTIRSVYNQLLDSSSFNTITTTSSNSASSVQSFIAIKIPFYNYNIIIDPDFSVLLDNSPVINDKNSICNYSNSSKLSASQLAGIIIGSIAFASIIIISITYYILKKRSQKQMVLKFEKKLENLKDK